MNNSECEMGKYVIRGGNSLCGSVTVAGAKNAALPVIFASLILFGKTEIVGLPDIGDVRVALELIKEQGARVTKSGRLTVIDTAGLEYRTPSAALVSRLRASTYLIGASLARFGRAEVGGFGGCAFSHRPIDYHLAIARGMGATQNGDTLTAPRLSPVTLRLPRPSVGATVNFLIMASATEGESRLYSPACEPHIDTLIDLLRSAGAHIERGTDLIRVRGGTLGGGRVVIDGDPIEAGTYISASLATGGAVTVNGLHPDGLLPFLDELERVGASVDVERGITVTGEIKRPLRVVAAAHPGFPTDLQPIVAPLMAVFRGGSIRDTVWEGRYGYLSELVRLGVGYRIDSHGAEIFPSRLSGGSATALDLRGGASCIIAALAADGYSEIFGTETVGRGYDHLTDKLRALGADVEECL